MFARWVYRIYNGLVLVSAPFIIVGIFLRWRNRLAKGAERESERRGYLSQDHLAALQKGTWWWIHAVSLGEVKAIEVFLREVGKSANVKVFLTLVTPEALAWATEKKLADLIAAAPIDLPWIVRRMFR